MTTNVRPGAQTPTTITAYDHGQLEQRADSLATEEPLEIRVMLMGESRTVAVTMRTPGADFELAVGFLFGEGVIQRRDQVLQVSYCKDTNLPVDQLYNIVIVELEPTMRPDLRPLERHFHMSSACGVCGKASLEAIAMRGTPRVAEGPTVSTKTLATLPSTLESSQPVFSRTGGLHAAGLFDSSGNLIAGREDVGRHNALDKVIGWALLDDRLPLSDHIALVSGRSSFELAQKCVVAGIPILCSVSAPSSLAVEVAGEFGMTLVGFVRDTRMNVYAGASRIIP